MASSQILDLQALQHEEEKIYFSEQIIKLLHEKKSDLKPLTRILREYLIRAIRIEKREHLMEGKLPLPLYVQHTSGQLTVSGIRFRVERCGEPHIYHEEYLCVVEYGKAQVKVSQVLRTSHRAQDEKRLADLGRHSFTIYSRKEKLTLSLYCVRVPKKVTAIEETDHHELIYKVTLKPECKRSRTHEYCGGWDSPLAKLDSGSLKLNVKLTNPEN